MEIKNIPMNNISLKLFLLFPIISLVGCQNKLHDEKPTEIISNPIVPVLNRDARNFSISQKSPFSPGEITIKVGVITQVEMKAEARMMVLEEKGFLYLPNLFFPMYHPFKSYFKLLSTKIFTIIQQRMVVPFLMKTYLLGGSLNLKE